MYDQFQKQNFVSIMVNNAGYLNKQPTILHINQFLKYNNSFSPRQTIRDTKNGSFISFIELTGFVLIENLHVEMYIGVPISYPKSAPVFLLAVDKNNYYVNEQQKLLQFNLIANEKNQKGEDFIRLRFQILQKQWNPKLQTLNSIFNNVMQIINRPPLIKPKLQNKPVSSYQQIKSSQKIKRLNSKQVTQVVSGLHNDLVQIIIGKQNLQQSAESFDYSQCRQQFLKNHLPALKTKLTAMKKLADGQSQKLKSDYKEIQSSGDYNKLLEISQQQNVKLEILSQQQVLKQAEVKLRSKMQKDTAIKFSDYKKIMKVLYEKMFDNQTKLLKSGK